MSRLAEVRDRYDNDREIAKYAGITLTLEDYDWLVEQANHAEILKSLFIRREDAEE